MRFLDVFFTVFHTLVILFNLFGWIWKRTRKANLICILLTAGSWLILGIFYGIGYCPFTDWHFTVLERLGYNELPSSYISFLVNRLTGIQPEQGLVDALTAWGLAAAFAASLFLNYRYRVASWFSNKNNINPPKV
jgi:hypothetical protein